MRSERPRPIEREYLVRPVESCQQADPEAERVYREQQSRELVGLLQTSLRRIERLPQPGGAEGAVNKMDCYLQGWTDSLIRTGPDLADELASELQRTMCDPNASETQIMLSARVLKRMPELGNAEAFDCVAKRGTEDAALWDALEAWRLGSLPKTPALEELARSSKDERTQMRLVKFAEESQSATLEPSVDAPPPSEPAQDVQVDFGVRTEANLTRALERARAMGQTELEQSIAATLRDLHAHAPTVQGVQGAE